MMCIAQTVCKSEPVYMYRFDYTVLNHHIFSNAVHCIDIPFVFHNLDLVGISSPQAQRLSDEIQAAWIAFATDGNPCTEQIKWPEYDSEVRKTLILDCDFPVKSDPWKEKRMQVFR